MMGRSHLITGACALEHVYVAGVLIDKTQLTSLMTAKEAVWDYLGITSLMQGRMSPYGSLMLIVPYFALFFIGTLLPDIDNPKSILGRAFHLPVRHRTWLHAIYIYLIPAVLGYLVHPVFSWLFFGVFVHLFWDSFSAMGNCWFYKLFSDYKEYPNGARVKKGHWLKLYHAGTWSEGLLLFVIVALTIISFIWIRPLEV